ncbi:MAG: hypothetical protein AAF390_06360 [Pseudomonadota bacterium]
MRVLGSILVACLVLSGCGVARGVGTGLSDLASPLTSLAPNIRGGTTEVSGVRFRTRLSADGGDRRSFSTLTRRAAVAPVAAAEAGRVEAVGYCLRTFGGSQILWSVGPETVTAEEASLTEDGGLVLRGRCVAR